MIEKAAEVKADAIGMSGLLVKSTLIMRDNLEELNGRGPGRDIPVLLGGAALTRTYVERDLREVYEGRLFYGKDAFEGLRVMDRLGELKRGTGEPDDPSLGPRARASPRWPSRLDHHARPDGGDDGEVRDRALARGRDRQPGVRAAVRRLQGRQGHPPRRHRRLPQRDRPVPQPVAVPPEKSADGTVETDAEFKDRHPPDAAGPAGRGQGGRRARAPGGVRLLRGQQRGQRPRHLEGRDPQLGVDALRLPPPARRAVAVHRRLLPAGGVGRARTTSPSTS